MICSRCNEDKSDASFTRGKQCKDCLNVLRRERFRVSETRRVARSNRSKRWEAANPEKVKVKRHRWQQNHLDYFRNYNNARNAKKRGLWDEDVDIAVLVDRDRSTCKLCGSFVDITLEYPDPGSRSIDHVVPISKGGRHSYANTQLAHFGCNSSKKDKQILGRL